MEDLKNIFYNIQIILRYVVSGFISVIVIGYLDNGCHGYLKAISLISPWILVALSAILGIITYGIHQAIFDKLFYQFFICRYLRNHTLDTSLSTQIRTWITGTRNNDKLNEDKIVAEINKANNIRFALFSQTYLRRSSEDPIIVGIQKELDKKLAMLNFLYCTFYSLCFISLIIMLKHLVLESKDCGLYHPDRVIGVLILSGVVLFSEGSMITELPSEKCGLLSIFFKKFHLNLNLPTALKVLFLWRGLNNCSQRYAASRRCGKAD